MMMSFKKVYIEITNSCNLKCDFCIGNRRSVRFMSFSDFKYILKKIKPYTKYLYFHILGEPLMHPNIIDFIDYASCEGFYVNITTNGYLIDRLKGVSNIRQLNISLHSYNPIYGVSIDKYLNNIFSVIGDMDHTYISFRLWVDFNKDILKYICDYYNIDSIPSNFDHFSLSKNVFLSSHSEFVWPDLSNDYYCERGKCYGLIDHFGILCDGRIVPCCLDSNASICLGNIFDDNLDDVLHSERVLKIIDGFRRSYKCEELCRHCNFLNN